MPDYRKTSGPPADYIYDAAGNLMNPGPTQPYVYDAENHLTSAGGLVYLYDGDGKRVAKAPSNTPTQPNYIYWYGDKSSPVIDTDGAGNFQYRYISFNGMLVSREEANDWVDHYGLDALGNVRYVYGYNGTSDFSDFYPFGTERVVVSGTNNHFKFTGKERDAESGLDNFGERYFGSSLGRFMRPDPSNVSGDIVDSENPQAWNMYSYVLNNPLNGVDPDGLDYYLLGGDRCGQDIECDKQGYVLDNNGNRAVVTDQQINGSNGLAKIDANGNLQINTAQGTFQGEFFDPNIGANGAAIIPQAIVTPSFEEQKFMALSDAGAMATPGVNAALAITSPQLLFMGGATVALSGAGSTLTLEAGEIAASPGEVAELSQAAAQGGKAAVRKALRSFAKRLAQHQADLARYQAQGGYTSKTVSEIKHFETMIRLAEDYLIKNP